MFKIILTIALFICSLSLEAQFVELKGREFFLNDKKFLPLVMNYVVNIRHEGEQKYWISRSMSYYTTPIGSNCKDETDCLEDIRKDFMLIKESGFNTLRVVDFEFGIKDPVYSKDKAATLDVSYYYGPLKNHDFISPFEDHFKVLDQLILIAKEQDLKIILVTGGKEIDHFPLSYEYNIYLKYLSQRYKDESTLLAFDLLNEPSYFHKGHSKFETQSLIHEWTQTIRANSNHILTTIGLADFYTSFDWDPLLLEVDFYSFHIYRSKDLGMQNYYNQLYWISKISNKAWIIGETGFAASEYETGKEIDGNLKEQSNFFSQSYRYCLDCGGSGYSWWQFHDAAWSPDYGMVDSFHKVKPFISLAKNYFKYIPNAQNCNLEQSFLRSSKKLKRSHSGKIIDFNREPIANAIVVASTISGKTYTTISKDDGSYTVNASSLITKIRFTAPGYSIRKKSIFCLRSKLKLKKEIFDKTKFNDLRQKEEIKYCNLKAQRKYKYELLACGKLKLCQSELKKQYLKEINNCSKK